MNKLILYKINNLENFGNVYDYLVSFGYTSLLSQFETVSNCNFFQKLYILIIDKKAKNFWSTETIDYSSIEEFIVGLGYDLNKYIIPKNKIELRMKLNNIINYNEKKILVYD